MNKTSYTAVERYGKLIARVRNSTPAEKAERQALKTAFEADGLTVKRIGSVVVISDDAIELTLRKFKIG